MNIATYWSKAIEIGADVGLKILGAILLWIVGRWIIGLVARLAERALKARGIDETVGRYLQSFLGGLLTVVLVVAVLGVFGVQTASFAALLAAVGVAVGMAWSGLLANFAAGMFMLVLRPVRVGDVVEVGGVTGIVREIGILVTAVDTFDNVRTIVGNQKVFSETIRNYSANHHRRVELKAQLGHGADPRTAIDLLAGKLLTIPHVLDVPRPEVDILEFNLAGPVLAVRPYCRPEHYWEVYFATNALIHAAFGEAGFPVPENHYVIRQAA